jgi:hypothetical protein
MTCPTSRPMPLAVRALSRYFPFVSFYFLFALLTWTSAWAQKDMGNIVGLVKDASGAAVADAKITVSDVDRGDVFHTTSSSSGDWVAGPLRIGQYAVTVEKPGFKKAVAGPLTLNVQDRLAVNVTLQVGTVQETMTITTEGPQLETETSELGQVVNSQTATALPLNGRNFAQLAQLAAGVAPNEPGARTETTFGFSSNGARALQNNFLLDGVDNNAYLGDVLNFSAYVIQPSVDAIGEFKVETNSYSAEFGRGNGAIMNAVIKSGTNRFHGEALEFIRNDKFDGKNAFDLFGRQQYQQNQFGANLGGPIIKDRTFFFGDYEGLRIRQALPTLALIPTPQQLSGDFSSFLNLGSPIAGVVDCSGNPTFTGEMFNPRLTQAFAGNPTGFCGVPIAVTATGVPTNIFPASGPSAIAAPAAKLAALYPAPNINFQGNNYLVDPKKSLDQNNFDVRVDHRFSDNDNFFTRFSYEDQPLFVPGPFTTALDGGGFVAGHQDNSYRSVAISELHTFSVNLMNEFRLGYNRINSRRLEPNSDTNVASQIGIPGVPFTPGFGGLPSMCFFDYACIGTNDYLPAIEKQNSFVINENLTWTHGAHSMKFGTELRREEFTILEDSAPRGDMTFSPDFSGNPGAPVGTAPGDDMASFFLGVPDGADIVNVHGPDYRRNIAAFFAEDDFRASDRLTLNLGIRYDLFRPITEGKNQQATFDFRSDTLFVPKGTTAQLTPTIASFLPLSATAPPGLVPPVDTDFSPRIGFAYQLTQKLVLRGGYGIFYGGTESGPFSFPSPGFSPPFFLTQTFSSLCGSAGALPAIANPALGNANCAIGVKPGTGSGPPDTSLMINNMWTGGYPANSLADPNNPQLFSLQPNLKNPMMQQWHLGLEYQLPRETVVKISYAGSHGQDLYGFYNGNQAALFNGTNSPNLDNRRPFPAVNATISTFRSNTISNYNSIQAHVEKRASHGLTFDASYTYAHSLDDASSASLGSLNNADFRNQSDPGLEYGNSDFDVRQHMVVSYAWELPFGRGRGIGGNASGFANGVIGNWQVNGIVSASTGNWFTVSDTTTNDTGVDCGGTVAYVCSRPNVVPGQNPNGKPCVAGTFFNTCAFASDTTPNTFGDEGRNIVRGPGYQIWDLSLVKAFPMNEGMRFEFRSDFFNMWNHTNPLWAPFGAAGQVAPVAIEMGTQQYGHYQAAKDPRFIQFAMKFYF